MPNALKIHGKCYPISTDFRTGLRFWNLCRRGQLTGSAALTLWFPGELPGDGEAAMEGIRRFYLRRDEPMEALPSAGEAVYDFLGDQDAITAGFQEKYGMDLQDPHLTLHWWRFMALLEGLMLPGLRRRAEIRTMDPGKLPPEQREEFFRLRRVYAIGEKKETLREHLRHLDEIIAGAARNGKGEHRG